MLVKNLNIISIKPTTSINNKRVIHTLLTLKD